MPSSQKNREGSSGSIHLPLIEKNKYQPSAGMATPLKEFKVMTTKITSEPSGGLMMRHTQPLISAAAGSLAKQPMFPKPEDVMSGGD